MLEETKEIEQSPSPSQEEKTKVTTSPTAADLRYAAYNLLQKQLPDWHERAYLPGLVHVSQKDQLPWYGMQVLAETIKELDDRIRAIEPILQQLQQTKGKKS